MNILSNLVDEIEAQPKAGPSNDLDELPYRVIHLDHNPYSRAVRKKRADIGRFKVENERLRARLSLLESYNGVDLTYRIDDAINNVDEIEILTKKVEELKARENKILTRFKDSNREFREACYLLTGYRIEPLKDDVFRLTHMYDNREGHNLYFEVKGDGTISLLENDYLNKYRNLMSDYLEKADSFPAFLAAITLKLFDESDRMNGTVDMSMTMSTTMIPNRF